VTILDCTHHFPSTSALPADPQLANDLRDPDPNPVEAATLMLCLALLHSLLEDADKRLYGLVDHMAAAYGIDSRTDHPDC